MAAKTLTVRKVWSMLWKPQQLNMICTTEKKTPIVGYELYDGSQNPSARFDLDDKVGGDLVKNMVTKESQVLQITIYIGVE